MKRLERHNSGFEKYTKNGIPWKLILSIECNDRSEAMSLEKKLKNLSRKRLNDFISNYQTRGAGPDLS